MYSQTRVFGFIRSNELQNFRKGFLHALFSLHELALVGRLGKHRSPQRQTCRQRENRFLAASKAQSNSLAGIAGLRGRFTLFLLT